MMLTSVLSSFALLASAVQAAPTLYLVGDSTMASHAASEGIQGSVIPIANAFYAEFEN